MQFMRNWNNRANATVGLLHGLRQEVDNSHNILKIKELSNNYIFLGALDKRKRNRRSWALIQDFISAQAATTIKKLTTKNALLMN